MTKLLIGMVIVTYFARFNKSGKTTLFPAIEFSFPLIGFDLGTNEFSGTSRDKTNSLPLEDKTYSKFEQCKFCILSLRFYHKESRVTQ